MLSFYLYNYASGTQNIIFTSRYISFCAVAMNTKTGKMVTSSIVALIVIFAAVMAITLKVFELPPDRSGGGDGGQGGGSGGGSGGGGGGGQGNGTGPGNDTGIIGDTTTTAGGGGGLSDLYSPPAQTSGGSGGGGGLGGSQKASAPSNESEKPVSNPVGGGGGSLGASDSRSPQNGIGSAGGGFGLGPVEAPGGGGGNQTGNTTQPVVPEVAKWLIIAVLIGIVVFIALVALRHYMTRERKRRVPRKKKRKRTAPAQRKPVSVSKIVRALEKSILSLETATDIRGEIIRCYKELLKTMAAKGVWRKEATTPREFYSQCSLALGMRTDSFFDLTLLFEDAVYSQHELGEKDRDSAKAHLSRFLDEVSSWNYRQDSAQASS